VRFDPAASGAASSGREGAAVNGFLNLWNAIGQPITNASGQIINAIQAEIGRPFQLCVIAFLLIQLMIAIWSPNEDAIMHFLRQIGLAAVIFTLITTNASFTYYVSGAAQWLTNTTMQAIGGIFGQGAANVTAATFDTISANCFGLGLKVIKVMPWYSLKVIPLSIVVILYWFATSAAILLMFVAFLIASVSMSFVIAFGPIFISMAFFPYTRRFFDGWVSAVVGAMLTQIFVLALLALFTLSMNQLLQPLINGITGAAAEEGGIIITALQNLCLGAGIAAIFAVLIGFALKLAVTIAGTVGVQMPRVPISSFGRAPGALGGSGGGGGYRGPAGPAGPGAGAGNAGAGGASATGLPSRQYAFNRTVGSAP
jgi:type IV secretion system protein VirB6